MESPENVLPVEKTNIEKESIDIKDSKVTEKYVEHPCRENPQYDAHSEEEYTISEGNISVSSSFDFDSDVIQTNLNKMQISEIKSLCVSAEENDINNETNSLKVDQDISPSDES